jgi:hypothetical protein
MRSARMRISSVGRTVFRAAGEYGMRRSNPAPLQAAARRKPDREVFQSSVRECLGDVGIRSEGALTISKSTVRKGDPMRTISHFINGQSVTRTGAVTSPVYDPSIGQVQARLENGDAAILSEAVAVAKAAQPAWAAINHQGRARVIFKFKALIEEHKQELVHLMSSEHGKLLDDSIGELGRAWRSWAFCAASHTC